MERFIFICIKIHGQKNFDDWFQGDPHIVKVYED